MKINFVSGIHFSPTGNTAKVVNTIGRKIAGDYYKEIDMAVPGNRGNARNFTSTELLIVGVPVYRGRVPEVMAEEIKNWKGNRTPAVILVTYGNRVVEDALLELKDLLIGQGFVPFGAGMFSGQHSFNKQIGYNRPDKKDLIVAENFADEIVERLADLDLNRVSLVVAGERPYKKVPPMGQMPFLPVTDMRCIYCMICANYCPMEAISFSNPKAVDKDKCVRCTKCIKVCPVQAKAMTPDVFDGFVKKITTPNVMGRKEPWFFV